MNIDPHPRRTRWLAVLLPALLVLLSGALTGSARADDSGDGAGTVRGADGSLKFGMGPAKHVPADQVVDGRAYLSYVANPGATVLDRVAIFNYSRTPLTLRVYATDAVQSADGAFGLLPGDDTPADAGTWITLRVPKSGKVTVPGRGSQAYGVLRIPFIARIPAKATPGDHVGGVVASLKSTSRNKKGAKVTLDQRIGVRAYFALTGDLTPRVVVERLHGSFGDRWDPTGRGRYTVTYTVHNTGNMRLNVSQDLTVQRCIIAPLCPFGELTAHPQDLLDLLPGSTVRVRQTFEHAFGPGRPKADVTLHPRAVDPTYRKAIPPVSASAGFWALPWVVLILAALVLLLIAGWFWRRHRARAATDSVHRSHRRRG